MIKRDVTELEEVRARLVAAYRSRNGSRIQAAEQALVQTLSAQYASGLERLTAEERLWRMKEIMLVWNPIEFSTHDLVAVLGQPSANGPDYVEYRIDTGVASASWRFQVAGERVMGVVWTPGE